MKKRDEMDRNIQLRSEAWGYKAVLLALCAATLWNCGQTWLNHSQYHPWPSLLLGMAVCVQGFSQLALKRRMIAGDDEYHEPNKLLWTAAAAFVILVLAVALGVGLMQG